MPSGIMTDDEFGRYLAHVDRLFLRNERFGVVVDTRFAPPYTASQRQQIGQHMRASYARYPSLLAGLGVVMKHRLHRGIFTAVNWLSGPAFPHRAFDLIAEAEAWVLPLIRSSGL
jgi:hypothetical protein